MEKDLFLHLRSLLITCLIMLSLEKKLLFCKNSGKSLEFWIKNLYDPALITLTGNSKHTSANLLSLLGAQTKDRGAALQTLLTRGILCL